jgi:hypothetical protein
MHVRICNGCGVLVPEAEHRGRRGHCATCSTTLEREKSRKRRAHSATHVRNSKRWQQVRQQARARDGGCTLAHLSPCHGRLEAHHLIPIEKGGNPYALSNVTTVWRKHHEQLEQRTRARA